MKQKIVRNQKEFHVHSANNPFDLAAQTSNLSYGLYMMERNILRQKRLEEEEKEEQSSSGSDGRQRSSEEESSPSMSNPKI